CDSAAAAVASTLTWGHAGCASLSSVLKREQYGKPPLTLDPTLYPRESLPRGPELFASQLVNFAQYFDWQWGRSVAGREPVFGGARPLITLVVLLLGFLGLVGVWRRDRAAGLLLASLFLTLSLGLVVYLNFKYGFSLENARFPDWDMHEVRERDYFFLLGFSLWGVLAGIGLAAAWLKASAAAAGWLGAPGKAAGDVAWKPTPARLARLATAALFALALVPTALNWRWASRSQDWTARDWAYNVLMSVRPYGVLVTNGDNDSFPLWYAQNVEGIRTDVTVVLVPYLETPWYVKQLRDLTRPCPTGVESDRSPTRIVCQRPFHPEQLPPALAGAGMTTPARPPEDSIVPLSDAEIDRIAASAFIAPRALEFHAGALLGTIAAGTRLLPSDTFVATIVRSSIGERPIHFMTPSPVVARLGLERYTVRQGLTWKLSDVASAAARGHRIVVVPPAAGATLGAYVDVTLSDTLADDVWLRRGRVADARAPWTDSANASIPLNYATALLALAQAHAQLGDNALASTRQAQAREWIRLVE
ncbi:MAG TPA: hypothetical protein VF832_15780, partial [Longimicrobiales bacterium]